MAGYRRPSRLPADAIAVVNGTPIRTDDYRRAVAMLAGDKRNPLTRADRVHVLERLIEEELLVQAAVSEGLVERDRAVRQAITRAMLAVVVTDSASARPTREELRAFHADNAALFTQADETRPPAFEEIRSRVEAVYLQRAKDTALRQYLAWLRDEAEIVRAPEVEPMTGALAWACCLVVLLWSAQAAAHTRSQSFSSWHVQDGQVRGTFSVRALEATRLGVLEDTVFDLHTLLIRHLASRLVLTAGDEPCRTLAGPRARAAQAGYMRVEWRFACPSQTRLSMTNTAFFEVAPSHLHYARVRLGDGPPVEYLFTDSVRRQLIVAAGPEQTSRRGASFGAYVLLGLEHILSGVDHLAFVLALLLLCRRVREVVFMVSGFTLGHSLTLSLAVLGVVEPNVPVIEALIGFTIALVAAENIGISSGTGRRLGLVAGLGLVGCGLLHGLDWAGPAGPEQSGPGAVWGVLFCPGYQPRPGGPPAADPDPGVRLDSWLWLCQCLTRPQPADRAAGGGAVRFQSRGRTRPARGGRPGVGGRTAPGSWCWRHRLSSGDRCRVGRAVWAGSVLVCGARVRIRDWRTV